MRTDSSIFSEQVSSIATPAMLKRVHRAHRRDVRRAERAEWRRHFRCFWTVPFRHEWEPVVVDGRISQYRCVGCGKVRG